MDTRQDPLGYERWLEQLRQQFLQVARRRVPPADVEDVVQDALRVVHDRGSALPAERRVEGLPPLAWCFQALRHVVGNHYQRRHRRQRVLESRDPHAGGWEEAVDPRTPAEALQGEELRGHVHAALAELARREDPCHGYLNAVLDGSSARELALREGLEPAVLYRRLYRCRQKLRQLLAMRGVQP